MNITYTTKDGIEKIYREEAPWCRELMVEKIRTLMRTRSVRDFSVYGIIDGEGTYRPSNVSPIAAHGPEVGAKVTLLFHTTLALASTIFLDTPFKWNLWRQAWASSACQVTQDTISCIDVDDPIGAGTGSILNLPAWVGESIPLVSFLLYLPRVWYNLAAFGRAYTQINAQRMAGSPSKALLGSIASRLAEPLYHMQYGRSRFWSFLDFLVTAISVSTYKSEAQRLLLDRDCSGYYSWLHRLDGKESLVPWCAEVKSRYHTYREYGPSALIRIRIIEGSL